MASVADQEMQLRLAITASLVDVDEITKDMEQSLTPLQRTAMNMSRVASAAMVSAGAALGTVAAGALVGVKGLIAFEDAFAGVRKTVDADEESLALLSDQIRNLATEVPIAANELARIGELGGQLGIGVESLEQFIDTVAKLGVSTVLSTENAALALARLGAIANIPDEALGDFFERTASALVDLGNNFAATEDEIVTTVLRIATAAEQTGASTQDALAFATALQAIGVPAQAGGTAISRVFQEIERAIQNGDEQLQLFAEVAGAEMSEFARLFGEDSAMAVAKFIEGLGTAGDRGLKLQDILKKLNLSQRRTQLAINGLAAAGDLLTDTLETSRTAFDANIALNVEAAKKFTTTASQMQLLRNQFKEVTMSLGEELLPFVRQLIFTLQSLAQGIQTGALKEIASLSTQIIAFSAVVKAVSFALVKFSAATAGAAGAMAMLKALASPTILAPLALGLTTILPLIVKIKKEFSELANLGGGFAFSDVLETANQFGTGTAAALDALQRRREVYVQELTKLQESGGNEDNINKLDKQIEIIDEKIKALGNSIEFVVGQQLEKLTGASGPVGELFTDLEKLTNNTAIGGAASSLLEDLLVGGVDPEIALNQFRQDTLIPFQNSIQDEIDEIYAEAGLSDAAKNSQKQLLMRQGDSDAVQRIFQLEKQLEDIKEIQDSLNNQGVAFNVIQEESAKIAAERVLIANGETELNSALIESKQQEIITEREQGRIAAERAGLSADILKNTEFSRQVNEANALIQQKQAEADRKAAQETAFELTQREIAIGKVNDIAKKSSESIVNLFEEIPDQINMTTSEIVRNLQEQAMLGAEFMSTISKLTEAGFVGLAGMLAKEGPKALKVAQEFLSDPIMARAAEQKIAQANTTYIAELMDLADEIGASDQEIRDAFFGTGENLVDGLAEGIKAGDKAIREALIETVNKGIEGFQVKFEIASPSMYTFRHLGEPLIDGVARGISDGDEKIEKALDQAIGAPIEAYTEYGIMRQIGMFEKQIADAQKAIAENSKIDFTSDKYKQGLAKTKSGLSDVFDLYSNFSQTLGGIANQTLAVTQAERDLEKVRARGLKLTKLITDAIKERDAAVKKFGKEGITTDFERLGIMREQLSLMNMQRDAAKRGSASERIAIKDAQREVDFLEQAVKRGVASEDELQAAKERLAEMQGTTAGIDDFADREDFEARLKLQKEILDLEIKFQKELIDSLKTLAKEESAEVVSAQEAVTELQQEAADQAANEKIAAQAVTNEKLAQYDTQLRLMQLADELIGLGPEGESQFKKIATAVGMPEEEINALITQAKTMGETFATKLNDVATDIFNLDYITSETAIMEDALKPFLNDIETAKIKLNELYQQLGEDAPFPELLTGDSTPQFSQEQLMQMFRNFERGGSFSLENGKAMGGLIDVGNRALVGEFGPELVTMRPSGAHVTPLGNSSSSIVVNNLNVNVTGIPSDSQSARKAAISIRKALLNLEKEGTSSSITLR